MFSNKASFLENMHKQDWLFEDAIKSSEASATSLISSPSLSKPAGYTNHPSIISSNNENQHNNTNLSPRYGYDDDEVGDQFERKAQERRKEALANFLLNYDNDLYFILGVSHAASKHDIRQQFKKLSLVHHPDKHLARPAKEKDTNDSSKDQNQQFSAISNAYKILSNDRLREIYDTDGYQAVLIAMRAEAQE